MSVLNETVDMALTHYSRQTSKSFKADVFAFVGDIRHDLLHSFRSHMEMLATQPRSEGHIKPDNLVFVLWTPGGVAEVVEQMVRIIRYHYKEVWFVVPDLAMSAGTILCMSGDKIYMDYTSCLGPIDPQIQNSDGHLVPALGYLDQVARMIQKSADNILTDAEFAILQNQDLAALHRYEQARELSISLLKDWLVRYKFKDWNKHSRTGENVTEQEKADRAKEIATELSNHKRWYSHGRMIGIKTLTESIKLKIEDYTQDVDRSNAIRQYSGLLMDCVKSRDLDHLFHFIQYIETAE